MQYFNFVRLINTETKYAKNSYFQNFLNFEKVMELLSLERSSGFFKLPQKLWSSHDESEKNDFPNHNKLENSDSPQVIMTPLISIANQWRVNSFMTFSNDDEIVYLIYSQ